MSIMKSDAYAQQGLQGDWLGLAGKVCVVSGAASGIGAAITNALAAQGANVVLLDRNREGCVTQLEALSGTSGRHLALACDVTSPDQIEQAVVAVKETYGSCQALVNAAGILHTGGLDEISVEDWNRQLAVNLTGYLLCARAFIGLMTGGSIIHIGSISGTFPQPFSGAYSPSKAAVSLLSKQMAVEWGPRGIRSNVVAPGMIKTAMTADWYQQPGVSEAREAFTASGRIGLPQDIADAVLFLASSRSGYINGADIGVDGGLPQVLMGKIPRPGFSAR
ncbi:oxidoreductase [Salmonella enterica subsp. enterica serovar Choleraesuis]|nr:oxidoreductase [Salmonella enterica subsp. enterica serovar Choleraesuis]